jgi:hypothetical protein
MDRYVYTFSGMTGAILWKSPAFEHYIRNTSPMYDLNRDGEPDIVEKCKKGHTAGKRTYKVHLDGFYLTHVIEPIFLPERQGAGDAL